ncbi:MAG: 50S ribosomal protein L18 [Halothiobacillus sp.]|jgi:large subunit ribosomal protein L18|uniref:50S ribosomal protein L18 n=1 Tax=Halothiobacillus sp. TaxID=1891311 RepID=UPI002AD23603|nr:50S ribosomal protein L18 [Halothiobacillus sp.]MDA3877084.1 50S ribosomal protein L18 [Halothiobacillus sp.]
MNEKSKNRLRRARRTRAKIVRLGVHRLTVYRTAQHTYAQIFTPDGTSVVASASTLSKDFLQPGQHGGNVDAAKRVGAAIAQAAIAKGITSVAFDRAGFIFHGRIKALAESAREAGLQF